MKIRAQAKMVKGKRRWYLVSSYRDNTGRPRTRYRLYLGPAPNDQIKASIAEMNESFARKDEHSWEGKYLERIEQIKCRLRKDREFEREKMKERIREKKESKPPPLGKFTVFLCRVVRLKQDLQKCIRLKPLENRTREELEALLSDTQWVEEVRKLAMQSLKRFR
ncbi:MAG: hypothetical protein ABSH38_06035 [Verrucomicrobiota bacterium]|jgi:hypothetical protein